MTPVGLLAKVRTNWRGVAWVAIAVLAAGLGIAVSSFVGGGVAPSGAEQAARGFVAAWNRADYRQAATYLDTTVSADQLASALSGSVVPIRDLSVDRIVRQDDREAVIAYNASVPDAPAAVVGVVVANGLRYNSSCVDANARGARYTRMTDTLVVDRGADGAWRIKFQPGASTPASAALLGLAYGLSPKIFFAQLGSGADPKSARYDDQVIAGALAVYQRDVGSLPSEDPTDASADAVRLQLKAVSGTCEAGSA